MKKHLYNHIHVNSTDLQTWPSRPCGVASDCLLQRRTVYWPSVQTPTWFHQGRSIRPYYGLSSPVNKCLFNDYLIYFVICDIYQWLASFLDQVFSFIKFRDIKKKLTAARNMHDKVLSSIIFLHTYNTWFQCKDPNPICFLYLLKEFCLLKSSSIVIYTSMYC